MIVTRGVVRNGQVIVEQPIDLPDGSEVLITGGVQDRIAGDDNRPPTQAEIAAALAAMEALEPLEISEQERAEAEAWERKVNAYGIANMDRGITDALR
jgi:hypothetical protein